MLPAMLAVAEHTDIVVALTPVVFPTSIETDNYNMLSSQLRGSIPAPETTDRNYFFCCLRTHWNAAATAQDYSLAGLNIATSKQSQPRELTRERQERDNVLCDRLSSAARKAAAHTLPMAVHWSTTHQDHDHRQGTRQDNTRGKRRGEKEKGERGREPNSAPPKTPASPSKLKAGAKRVFVHQRTPREQ